PLAAKDHLRLSAKGRPRRAEAPGRARQRVRAGGPRARRALAGRAAGGPQQQGGAAMGGGEQLKRALILLALGSFACKPAPARELAGEAPPFHDQRIYESMLDATIEPDAMPALLPVDVRGDAIHVGRFDNTLIFRRGGSTELEERDNAVPVRVPASDEL